MKRFSAAALAAATAVSLAAAPAQAATFEPLGYDSSSDVTVRDIELYGEEALEAENREAGTGVSKPFAASSRTGVLDWQDAENAQNLGYTFASSIKNDANKGYKYGTTYDIIVGSVIAVFILAIGGGAAALGLIPGVPAPALPF